MKLFKTLGDKMKTSNGMGQKYILVLFFPDCHGLLWLCFALFWSEHMGDVVCYDSLHKMSDVSKLI